MDGHAAHERSRVVQRRRRQVDGVLTGSVRAAVAGQRALVVRDQLARRGEGPLDRLGPPGRARGVEELAPLAAVCEGCVVEGVRVLPRVRGLGQLAIDAEDGAHGRLACGDSWATTVTQLL